MPEVIGKSSVIHSNIPSLDAHVSHMRHLTNFKIAKEILKARHNLSKNQIDECYKIFCSHISQGLEFHAESRRSSLKIKPILQYYAFLNLAVATILAFRPLNFNQYKKHGVEDRTYALKNLDISSTVLRVNKGAVPLFHSIFSDIPLMGGKYTLGHLASGFHMCHHELNVHFKKQTQSYVAEDNVFEINGKFFSKYNFYLPNSGVPTRPSKVRIENAMPILKSSFNFNNKTPNMLEYTSKQIFPDRDSATKWHKSVGIKLINYGGHSRGASPFHGSSYCWHGAPYSALIPSLSSILLLSFSFSSIVRYRPILLDSAINSPISLILDIFISEADSIFLPSIRNLLYREEMSIISMDCL